MRTGTRFLWESVSRRASIEAYKEHGGTWRLIYKDKSSLYGLSYYLIHFAKAADFGSIKIIQIDAHVAIPERINQAWGGLDDCAKDRLSLFAAEHSQTVPHWRMKEFDHIMWHACFEAPYVYLV